uniref:p0402A09.17 protein n=1 Tax=Oryza sativa subsp. japonica TaxID=39947 RepID=Q7F2F0_ORYSJ|nr:P0402A09.17 [Oryza sativa Japonica Group]BAB92136.1 P0455C04.11 [Oryza sativa Japonica Group]
MVDKNDRSDTDRISNGQPRSHVAPVSAGSGDPPKHRSRVLRFSAARTCIDRRCLVFLAGRRSFHIQRESESLRLHPKPPAEPAKGGLRGLPPLEPSTFLDVLTRPSVKDASGKDSPVSLNNSSGATKAERVVADIETTDDWHTPLIKFIGSEELPEDDAKAEKISRKAKVYCMIGNDLYKKAPNGVLLKCVSSDDGRHLLLDIHERICGSHAAGRTLVGKAFRQGFL